MEKSRHRQFRHRQRGKRLWDRKRKEQKKAPRKGPYFLATDLAAKKGKVLHIFFFSEKNM